MWHCIFFNFIYLFIQGYKYNTSYLYDRILLYKEFSHCHYLEGGSLCTACFFWGPGLRCTSTSWLHFEPTSLHDERSAMCSCCCPYSFHVIFGRKQGCIESNRIEHYIVSNFFDIESNFLRFLIELNLPPVLRGQVVLSWWIPLATFSESSLSHNDWGASFELRRSHACCPPRVEKGFRMRFFKQIFRILEMAKCVVLFALRSSLRSWLRLPSKKEPPRLKPSWLREKSTRGEGRSRHTTNGTVSLKNHLSPWSIKSMLTKTTPLSSCTCVRTGKSVGNGTKNCSILHLVSVFRPTLWPIHFKK